MNDLFISTKKVEDFSKKEIGNYVSDDRFYTYINIKLDEELKKSNKFIRIIISFLYSSSNYRHSSENKKSVSLSKIIIDTFCVFCVIALIVCIATGILTPLISFIKNPSKGFQLANASQIVAVSFGVFFLIISALYLFVNFKFRRVNKSLSLQIYVQKKVNTILSLKTLLKLEDISSRKIRKLIKKTNQKEEESAIFFDNINLVNLSNIWLAVQLLNEINKVFNNIKMGLIFRNLSDLELESWINIVKNDFLTLNTKVENPKFPNNDVSKLNYGSIPSYNLPTSTPSKLFSTFLMIAFGGVLGGTLGNLIIK